MSATFSAPLAALLLAVELLLFEWKPRSLVPVGLASACAAAMRHYIIGPGPLFPVPVHPAFIGGNGLLACVLVGLLAGLLSMLLTAAVYGAEDAFQRLLIHWMWWPPVGGVVIGIGGLIFRQALGVGYDTLARVLSRPTPVAFILGILVVKALIWSISLGSGTSGGVLAPLLMLGGALGGLEAMFLPGEGVGFWPLVSMGAVLGGTMRSPLTGVVFALELTHDINALLPLLVASVTAHGFSVLMLKRSILTEKIARRGHHLSREYAVDPLEVLFVREVMRTGIKALPVEMTRSEVSQSLQAGPAWVQMLFPILDPQKRLVGVVTRRMLQRISSEDWPAAIRSLADVARPSPVVAYPNEPLRVVIYRMAETGWTRFPVVSPDHPGELLGMISLYDLMQGRVRALEDERCRQRTLEIRMPFSGKECSVESVR